MNFFLWAVLGGFAGWIASKIMGKSRKMGLVLNIAVGVAGAFIGGWIAGKMGFEVAIGFNLPSLFIAVLGAIVLIAVVGLLRKMAK
ncbi:MAG: GlsB/YeaQ/YmgE family stress response membrane protein [Christensenellales bacterium]